MDGYISYIILIQVNIIQNVWPLEPNFASHIY